MIDALLFFNRKIFIELILIPEYNNIIRHYEVEPIHSYMPAKMSSTQDFNMGELMEFKNTIWVFEACDPSRLNQDVLHPLLIQLYKQERRQYATYLLLGHENPVRKSYDITKALTIHPDAEPTADVNLNKLKKKIRKTDITKNVLNRFYQS